MAAVKWKFKVFLGVVFLCLTAFVYLHQRLMGYPWTWSQVLSFTPHHEHFALLFLVAAILCLYEAAWDP